LEKYIHNVNDLELFPIEEKIYIYGAGVFAHEIIDFLLLKKAEISGIIVTEISDNPDCIYDIPIVEYNAAKEKIDKKSILIVAINQGDKILSSTLKKDNWEKVCYSTAELIDEIIKKKLNIMSGERSQHIITDYPDIETGFAVIRDEEQMPIARTLLADSFNVLVNSIDICTRNALQKMYGYCDYITDALRPGFVEKNAEIFIVTSLKDKVYVCGADFPGYTYVQAGASLTEIKKTNMTDDQGDNISGKNDIYSECTVHYWVWKNIKNRDYVGINHYRRKQYIDDSMVAYMKKEGIDFLLAMPQFTGKMIKDFYLRYITEDDWKIMLEAIKDEGKDYAECLLNIKNGYFYFPCNICFASKPAFDEYCTYLFTVCGRIEDYIREKSIIKKKRYMGYLTEILESVYFMRNKNSIRTAYTDIHYMKS